MKAMSNMQHGKIRKRKKGYKNNIAIIKFVLLNRNFDLFIKPHKRKQLQRKRSALGACLYVCGVGVGVRVALEKLTRRILPRTQAGSPQDRLFQIRTMTRDTCGPTAANTESARWASVKFVTQLCTEVPHGGKTSWWPLATMEREAGKVPRLQKPISREQMFRVRADDLGVLTHEKGELEICSRSEPRAQRNKLIFPGFARSAIKTWRVSVKP